MKLIIDIPKANYEKMKKKDEEGALGNPYLMAIAQGTPFKEPKTGYWEWVQYDANPKIGNFHCSECRYIPAIFNMSAQNLNYCPNCGAKMAESEEV